jgi:hypothetical protein
MYIYYIDYYLIFASSVAGSSPQSKYTLMFIIIGKKKLRKAPIQCALMRTHMNHPSNIQWNPLNPNFKGPEKSFLVKSILC